MFHKLRTAHWYYMRIFNTEPHENLLQNMETIGRNSFMPSVKVCHWPNFHEIPNLQQLIKYSYNEFHENPANSLVTDARSHTNGWTDKMWTPHEVFFSYFVKNT